MSRNRNSGGRRSDSRREQQPSSPSPSPSFQRGGGGGGGRGGGGGGRGRGGGGPVSGNVPPSAVSRTPAAYPQTTSSSSASSSRAPPAQSSAPVEQLRREVEQKLVTGDPAVMEGTQPPPPSSSKAVRFAARPGYGSVGMKCVVRANHFLVKVADIDLYHYDVTISPEVTSKTVNRNVVSQLVNMFRESHLGNKRAAYDGRKSLYTAGPLPFESKEFVVKLVDKEPSGSTRKQKEREFKVVIKFAAKTDMHHLQQFLAGRQMDSPQETIQALDVVLRASPSEIYTIVGRSFFSPKLGPRDELGYGMEYWRGYYQSLRPTQMGLSLNVDVSARSFYEPILVTEFVAKYLDLRELSRQLLDRDRVKVKKALKGLKVGFNNGECIKSFKITGVSDKPVNQIFFARDDGSGQISVVQYFRERYNIGLKYTFLPALQAGNASKPISLPMELCKIAEGQRYSKKLNERQVTALLKATCQRPHERERSIKQMVKQNGFNDDVLVGNEFGIQVNEELTPVDARVLPPPMLTYHETGGEARVNPRFGQWNMINKKMVNGGKVDFWTCVNFSSRVHPNFPSDFCHQLIQMCVSKGMVFKPNPLIPVRTADSRQIERVLRDLSNECNAKLANQKGARLQLLIIILPDIKGAYGPIKLVCETELGIVSQCCQPKEASKLSKQYLENLSLKINVKVGGRNTVLSDAIQRRIPLVTDRPTIIFGADVTHPPPGEDSSASIAAVVASMDWPEVTKYRGIVSAQKHREEIIQDLYKSYQDPQKGLVHSGMIRELFIAYRRSTGQKPSRIIFYRDGVSEGQFAQVLLYEMDAIRKACASLEEGYLPPVTFIVVQKRHHTRLFPVDAKFADRSGNILPGTVIDTTICHQREFDFYLNSHAGIKGTSRPTHYHVLYDENRFTADGLQILTNNLCYTYVRCTRSVSIVPPAYYAHLAAFRARSYSEGETSDVGSSSGQTVSGRSSEVQPLPSIKDNVKDVMFYC